MGVLMTWWGVLRWGMGCVLWGCWAVTTVQAAPFTNGSFEAGDWNTAAAQASGTDAGYGRWLNVRYSLVSSRNLVTGWVPVVGRDFSWHELPTSLSADGIRSVDLNGNAAGGLEQTFDTVAGHTYSVAFSASRHQFVGSSASLRALAMQGTGGSTLATHNVTIPTTVGVSTSLTQHWQEASFTFVAATSSTTLRFTALQPTGGVGPMVDNVRVTDLSATPAAVTPMSPVAVPALSPAMQMLLAAVLAGVAALVRHHRYCA
jgi:hypothetical protein